MANSIGKRPTDPSNEGVPKQLLVLDKDLCVKAASESFYTSFKTTPGELLGKKLDAVGNGQWAVPALLSLLQEMPAIDGEFDDFEMEPDFVALGRRTMWVSGRRLPPLGDTQSGMILLSIDVAAAPHHGEGEKFDESLSLLRTTLASIGDAVIVIDLESRVTFMNPAAEKLTGWQQGDALHRHLKEVYRTVSGQGVEGESPVEKAVHQDASVVFSDHAILIARDGSEWPIDSSAAPFLDAAGEINGVVLVFHDVSARREAKKETEFSEVRYRRLFESAHDGILILDAVTAKVLDVNPFMGELLGYPREHFLGKQLWEISVFQDAESSKAAMATLQKLGHIRYENHPLQHSDGRQIPVEFVSNVYREGRRNVIQCNIRDITERTRLTADLARAREAAEAASKSKSEFLANMSHEIRTPMNAILGFAEMLQNKSPEECAQAGCVQIIRRNAAHLLELIDEILDLSKVEAGQITIERIECDLPALLSEVISLMRPRAAEKGLAFEVAFEGPIPRLIHTDPTRLRQILINLLGNAVKFTESGHIDVRITEETAGGPNIVLRVTVLDSGIGMTAAQLERLFQPFTQGDESITRKFGGTGLGLTISRQLARLLGGDVTATSQWGIGSAFTLKTDGGPSAGVERLQDLTEATLPHVTPPSTSSQVHLRGRILLVEDGADNQRLLRMQLGDAGASVVSAVNGRIAVELATTEPFGLILMDMQMPVMDGYAATAELRRRGQTVPIVAMTAYAMADDREKCLASGCNGYLPKPVDEETLLKTVRLFLGKAVPAGGAVSTAPSVSPTGVDDSSDLLKSSLAGDPRMQAILPGFVSRLPGKVRNMLELLERKDSAALQTVVHDLLGVAAGYGFAAVSPLALKAQQSLRDGAPLERITAEIHALVGVVRRIEGYDESKASDELGDKCAKGSTA